MTPAVLPASTRVGRVTLQVADLARSRRFYEDIIGFRCLDQRFVDGLRVARLSVADATDWLLELREKPGARRVPPRGLIGLYHVAILLPDRAALGRFIVHAANAGARLASADHLVSEALYLTDPDGLQIEVYCDRSRDTWQYRAGEIVMASLALNFDPIIASAGSIAWTGLPARTTIGHVHLYVADLDAARAFYVPALGFEPTVSSFPGALFVSAGGYHHHLGLNIWAAGAPVATDDDAKLVWWEVVTPDRATAEQTAERCARAGYTVARGADGFEVFDPWSIRVRITHADVPQR